MNENLLPKALAISDWITVASQQLRAAAIPSARLDAEIILAHTLHKSRTFLHAHGEDILSDRHHEIANARLQLRLDRTPIAYIIGHKEFYGRMFKVTPATLIPRPESEDIITLVQEIGDQKSNLRIVDVGTGSGCLGITIKKELASSDVTLTDINRHALNVASSNANYHSADCTILQSNLLGSYPLQADIIVANLPYVDREWEVSPETRHEPSIALYAEDHGLALIKKLIQQSIDHLTDGGHLLLEADIRQHDEIIAYAKSCGFRHEKTHGLIIQIQR